MIENCLAISLRAIGVSTTAASVEGAGCTNRAATTSVSHGGIETKNEAAKASASAASAEDAGLGGCGVGGTTSFGDVTPTQLAAYDMKTVESTGYETAGYLLMARIKLYI